VLIFDGKPVCKVALGFGFNVFEDKIADVLKEILSKRRK
jgi:hypothetical protein